MPVDPEVLLALCAAAFVAGMVDAIVGGGGLIQLPALLLAFPNAAVATIFGTNKLASVFGTSVAAVTYIRRIPPVKRFVIPMASAAFAGSMLGANSVRLIPAEAFKPIVLVALTAVWVYTWLRKDFGEIEQHHPSRRRAAFIAGFGGFLIGFYDGLIGPGTGSFLIFLLVGALGMSFLRASATAKIINVATNVAALILFGLTGHVMVMLGLVMAACNIAGSVTGSKLALARGSRFVRNVFLVIVAALIVRLGWDVLA